MMATQKPKLEERVSDFLKTGELVSAKNIHFGLNLDEDFKPIKLSQVMNVLRKLRDEKIIQHNTNRSLWRWIGYVE